MLDDALATVAARQIEVDVGPFTALFGQKSLEEQLHADRIDGRNPEAVADSTVGGRTPSLHEDVVLSAEIHDVPDDQEIAGKVQLFDQVQFARHLVACALVIGPVPLARPNLGELPQKRGRRFAGGHGILGKPVTKVGHRVLSRSANSRVADTAVGMSRNSCAISPEA